jgi:hypothetical protein
MSFPLMPLIQPAGTPGVDWSPVGGLATSVDMRQLAVSPDGTWIAVRDDNVNTRLRSLNNGTTWTSGTVSGSDSASWRGAAYGGGVFVLSQTQDKTFSSPDGVTWTIESDFPTHSYRRVTYNDGYFIVGANDTFDGGFIRFSSNGTTWTSTGDTSGLETTSPQCGIYVSSLSRTFVGGTEFRYLNSAPATTGTWLTPTGLANVINDVAWSATAAIAVTVGSGGIYSSTDLITWTRRSTSANMYGVAWCDDQFVAVGSTGKIFTSPNGVTWTSRTSGTSSDLYGVARRGDTILAVGSLGTVLRSS